MHGTKGLASDPLRPSAMDGFIGQSKLKKVLEISINGAKSRNEPVGHTLFVGPPGLGKTTLANIIATEMDCYLTVASATSLTKIGSLMNLLERVRDFDGGVLFIDEIHRLPRPVEEAMYSVMEDFRLDVTNEKMHYNMELPKFTLVGATTRQGMITKPMNDRFISQYHLDWYTDEEIIGILKRSAAILKLEIEDKAASEIAARCKKTPRVANNLLRQSRDFAHSYGIDQINWAVILGMMEMIECDSLGLMPADRNILNAMIDKFGGGPVGIDALSALLVEEVDVIERVHEPYLLQCGLIERTARGRVVTQRAYNHLKKNVPPNGKTPQEMSNE